MCYSHVVGQVVLLLHVSVKAVRYFVEVVLADTADETVGLHVLLHAFQLISQFTERVNDQTCDRDEWLVRYGGDLRFTLM